MRTIDRFAGACAHAWTLLIDGIVTNAGAGQASALDEYADTADIAV